ncbi:uncharacterized protein DS421_2g52080 [Arachis hypogaea]|nr:uncharacterized protein DS421_2g52080 [Arachis hypogaea]
MRFAWPPNGTLRLFHPDTHTALMVLKIGLDWPVQLETGDANSPPSISLSSPPFPAPKRRRRPQLLSTAASSSSPCPEPSNSAGPLHLSWLLDTEPRSRLWFAQQEESLAKRALLQQMNATLSKIKPKRSSCKNLALHTPTLEPPLPPFSPLALTVSPRSVSPTSFRRNLRLATVAVARSVEVTHLHRPVVLAFCSHNKLSFQPSKSQPPPAPVAVASVFLPAPALFDPSTPVTVPVAASSAFFSVFH